MNSRAVSLNLLSRYKFCEYNQQVSLSHMKANPNPCLTFGQNSTASQQNRQNSNYKTMQHALHNLDSSPFSLCPHFKPTGQEVRPASLAIKKQTATPNWATLKMPPTALHDAADSSIAKRLIRTERTLLHGAFEFMLEAFNEPFNFQAHASEDY
ncbi:hypothetical protein PDIDSM_6151 [Penicillium digitatum]|nr:hypothetical protein PDIDSM_6151 [Penicillium digitatum]